MKNNDDFSIEKRPFIVQLTGSVNIETVHPVRVEAENAGIFTQNLDFSIDFRLKNAGFLTRNDDEWGQTVRYVSRTRPTISRRRR